MEANKKSEVIGILCAILGLEPVDIDVSDSFTDDLHMSPAAMTDFLDQLGEEGFEVEKIDMEEIDTLLDLFEYLGID
jgi:hypothetical protein